jgi:hypothetical protein
MHSLGCIEMMSNQTHFQLCMVQKSGGVIMNQALQSLRFSFVSSDHMAFFQSKASIPWWVWVLLIIALLIILYLVLRGSQTRGVPLGQAVTPPIPEPVVEPEDLTVIEGIGPKINQFLHDAGIQTYQQLAEADMQALDRALAEAGLRLADPTTWGQQAQLAADGEWDALKKLQDELKGGRVV